MTINYEITLVKATNKVIWIDYKHINNGKEIFTNYLKFVYVNNQYESLAAFSKGANDIDTKLLIKYLIKTDIVTILRISKNKTYILKLTPSALLKVL